MGAGWAPLCACACGTGWQAQARNCGHFARWSEGIRYGHCYARPAGPHQEGSQAWCWVEAGHITYPSRLHLSGTETAEPRISGNQKMGTCMGGPGEAGSQRPWDLSNLSWEHKAQVKGRA